MELRTSLNTSAVTDDDVCPRKIVEQLREAFEGRIKPTLKPDPSAPIVLISLNWRPWISARIDFWKVDNMTGRVVVGAGRTK